MKSVLFFVLKCAEINIPVGIPMTIGETKTVPIKPYFFQIFKILLNLGLKPLLVFVLKNIFKTCVLKRYTTNTLTKVALIFIINISRKLKPDKALNKGPE